jgi:hypothetical protein
MILEAQFRDAAPSRSSSASTCVIQRPNTTPHEQAMGQQVAVPGGLGGVGGQVAVRAMVGGELLEVGEEPHRGARTLIRLCQRSSSTVQPLCFTFNHRRVGPASYRLVSSLATRPRSRARSRLEPVPSEPAHGQHEVTAGDGFLQPGAPFVERAAGRSATRTASAGAGRK